jgi:kumamolisin
MTLWARVILSGRKIMQLKALVSIIVSLMFALTIPNVGMSQSENGQSHAAVLIPESTIEHAEDVGLRAHTNHLIKFEGKSGGGGSPSGETPGSLRSVYNLPSSGGGSVIAIVDAYDYRTAENDLNVFSSQFGLPACTTVNGCFLKVYASGTKPRGNCGWNQEAALDVEWAHAIAPNAKTVLVEAASNSFANLFAAVDVATSQVLANGGRGEVSMSWGGNEFSTEASDDSHFQHDGVVYFASSGDTGGADIYPSVSPFVVSAGGTSVNRNSSGGFVSETGWSGSRGGPSKYEAKPTYQSGIAGTDATQRSAPDFSFDAHPNTGVSVYDRTSCQGLSGWLVFGGTSVASPSLAGIVNLSGHFYINSTAELATIYGNYRNTSDFRDIISGTAGSFSCKAGYDFVTGVGSDQDTNGK